MQDAPMQVIKGTSVQFMQDMWGPASGVNFFNSLHMQSFSPEAGEYTSCMDEHSDTHVCQRINGKATITHWAPTVF